MSLRYCRDRMLCIQLEMVRDREISKLTMLTISSIL